MKKILVVVLVSFFLVGTVFAENDFVPHKKGDKAMLFEFSGLGFLFADSYKGGFGFKKFINDKTAVRGSIGFQNSKETFTTFIPEGYIGEDGYDKETRFRVEVAGEIHSNKGKIDPYFGAGTFFNLVRTKYADPVIGLSGTALQQDEIKNEFGEGATTGFGIFGLLGVEYAVNALFSLAAEYHLSFSLASQPDMVVIEGSGTETKYEGGKYTFFGINSVGILTLAIYLNR